VFPPDPWWTDCLHPAMFSKRACDFKLSIGYCLPSPWEVMVWEGSTPGSVHFCCTFLLYMARLCFWPYIYKKTCSPWSLIASGSYVTVLNRFITTTVTSDPQFVRRLLTLLVSLHWDANLWWTSIPSMSIGTHSRSSDELFGSRHNPGDASFS
jgi:hypothetical protein